MDDIERIIERSSKRNAYAVAALLVAISLVLALGDWPSGYYQILRVVTFGFSVAVAYREMRSEGRGWLILAVAGIIIFNPVFQLNLDKGDWDFIDLIFAAGYAAYGLVSATKALASAATPLIWIAFAATMGLTYYVNYYMPHGPVPRQHLWHRFGVVI